MEGLGAWAVVVAAGKGERLGLPYNKVFYRLAGRSLLGRCFDALASAGCFDGAVLVLSEEDIPRYQALIQAEGGLPLPARLAVGGATRQASVMRGLLALPEDAGIVAIHDAARAFVPGTVVRAALESARAHGSGVAATLVTDTIKRVDGADCSVETPDRAFLRAVQTPQAFRLAEILRAHRQAEKDGFLATDDAALYERYVAPARLCCLPEGQNNIKLTTPEDLRTMETRLWGTLRVGHGYDVHRLVEGRKLILCGVDVPFEKGLLGHSDADVAVHALMDALLGAAGLVDIGRHFPDSDIVFKDADSVKLLEQVAMKLGEMGYRPANVDVTIVCQRPRIAPYIDAMRANLARTLRMPQDCVNVKATTTEGLGFEGEGLGISSSAVAAITR